MPRIICTEKELVKNLKSIARGRSSYRNEWPWNLLYWDGERFWADCHDLYKALFNGRNINNKVVGSYQDDLANTGDATEWQLMLQCTDRDTDFAELSDQFRCLYMSGHFGGYLGEEWYEDGQGTVNCVEATPAWEDGIQFSYVDKNGYRYWAKERPDTARGQWQMHGLATPWINYDNDEKQPAGTPGKPLTKEQCDYWWTRVKPKSKTKVKTLCKKAGMDTYDIYALVSWVQGEGYWEDAVDDPYLAYLSACVMVNNINESWYGSTGKEVVRRIASWGSYYSWAKQKDRYKHCSQAALLATYWALRYPQPGIHACYGPGYKPSNTFYDPHYKAQGQNVYVF